MKSRLLNLSCLLVVAMSLFGCDHATKIAAKATLEKAPPMPVAPNVLHGVLELRYVENDDIAFSVFRQLGIPKSSGLLIGVATVAILSILAMVIMTTLRRTKEEAAAGVVTRVTRVSREAALVSQLGLALIFGGALGNVVDRLVRGVVIDFIHVKGWPVFNVADIAVVCGMILMGLARLSSLRKKTTTSSS